MGPIIPQNKLVISSPQFMCWRSNPQPLGMGPCLETGSLVNSSRYNVTGMSPNPIGPVSLIGRDKDTDRHPGTHM